MTPKKKSNKFIISFKENVQEIEIMMHMQEKAEIMGLSAYIKLLIKEDMEKCKAKEGK